MRVKLHHFILFIRLANSHLHIGVATITFLVNFINLQQYTTKQDEIRTLSNPIVHNVSLTTSILRLSPATSAHLVL